MREYLIFTIYAPMQAWGTVAVGEIRPVASRPTRSGLLGLLAAAMGIRRSDGVRLMALNQKCRIAVREDCPGSRIVDYHTAQVPSEKGKRVFKTRKDELGGLLEKDEKLNTILSNREYLTNGVFTACVWLEEGGVFTMQDMKEALLKPKLHVYLGRKSCPPAWPFTPEIINAENELKALIGYMPANRPRFTRKPEKCPVWTETDHGDCTAYTVRDQVADHERRLFGIRTEYHVPPFERGEA